MMTPQDIAAARETLRAPIPFDHAKERRSKRLNYGRDRAALQKWFDTHMRNRK